MRGKIAIESLLESCVNIPRTNKTINRCYHQLK
jgi:hypothetical protein